MKPIDLALDILEATNDGNDLSPGDLKLVELAANNRLSEEGVRVLEALRENATKPGGYTPPWFHGVEHLTIDLRGFVRWRKAAVEHFDFAGDGARDRERAAALDVARKCRDLETRGIAPSMREVVNFQEDKS